MTFVTAHCVVCNSKFVQVMGLGRRRIYCSVKCNQKAFIERNPDYRKRRYQKRPSVVSQCLTCDARINAYWGRIYCSDRCRKNTQEQKYKQKLYKLRHPRDKHKKRENDKRHYERESVALRLCIGAGLMPTLGTRKTRHERRNAALRYLKQMGVKL